MSSMLSAAFRDSSDVSSAQPPMATSANVEQPVARRQVSSGSVIIVGNFLHAATGTFGVCEELATQLAGADWHVVTTSHRPQRFLRLADMLATIWSERHTYEVAQLDVYSGPSFLWAEASCWLLRRLGCPYVLTLHGGALPAFAAQRSGRVSRLLASAAAVTTPSGYLNAAMSRYRADLILQPNPIVAANYTFRVRRQVRPHLLWVRAFHAIYNPVLAVKTVALLRHDFPEIRLTMVGPDRGDGAYEQTVKVARELGVESCVEFRGPVAKSRLPEVFSESDIFLNTTNVDNTPVTVVEALASGLCVVSTSVGGIPYLVEHERDALLVPADDPQEMSDAIRRILTTPALAEQLSIGGRQNSLTRDWSLLLPRWERLLLDVASGNEIGSSQS
jgi:glycosyltransferase involved in cell wall biosynthesis